MCIIFATTAHPHYALIIIDNRDEFILRPTSRPHWWTSHAQEILSARDLQRSEQGTWLGITKKGHFAVLTNFREEDSKDKEHPIQGTRSRGAMVTAWLTGGEEESTEEFVRRLLGGEGVKGVGGFSLVCGKLRLRRDVEGGKALEPLAIISNRSGTVDDVPWICGDRGEAYGLSNTSYDDPVAWPKVKTGKEMVLKVVEEAVQKGLAEEELVDRLYEVLDTNTMPAQEDESFEDYLFQLRKSIFIPSIGQVAPPGKGLAADEVAAAKPQTNGTSTSRNKLEEELKLEERPEPVSNGSMTGVYGTQRQTVLLVGWDGHVSFRERSLWDAEGNPLKRGTADVKFDFQIEGWEAERSA